MREKKERQRENKRRISNFVRRLSSKSNWFEVI